MIAVEVSLVPSSATMLAVYLVVFGALSFSLFNGMGNLLNAVAVKLQLVAVAGLVIGALVAIGQVQTDGLQARDLKVDVGVDVSGLEATTDSFCHSQDC